MNEITLVTAFFDIGRKDFNTYPRTNEQYLNYFKVWARMKNNLIVYTNKIMAEEVRKIRKEYGLLDKTTIIEIDNEEQIEPNLLKKIETVSKNSDFTNFRLYKNAVSNQYKYDYVMLLKYWCLADAVEKKLAKGMVAWIDFGFNHGDACYIKPEEFDFLWKTELADNKIHLFALNDIDERAIFRSVMLLNDCIMGCLLVLPDILCKELWELTKLAMESLIRVGFIDDDQLLLQMAYKERKEIFEIHKSNWFLPLKENGGQHLTVKTLIKDESKGFNFLKMKFFKYKQLREYISRLKKIIK